MITELDHVLIGVPDLEDGMDWWTSLTGVRPIRGGPHRGLGTHNALVGLGPHLYLELLAPDPEQRAQTPTREQLSRLDGPRPQGWCYACDDAQRTAEELSAEEISSARVPLSRQLPGGETLSWDLIFPSHSLGSAIPFLIDWGRTPRPTESAPTGCQLLEVTPIHPEPTEAQSFLARLGIERRVAEGKQSGLRLLLATERGEISIE